MCSSPSNINTFLQGNSNFRTSFITSLNLLDPSNNKVLWLRASNERLRVAFQKKKEINDFHFKNKLVKMKNRKRFIFRKVNSNAKKNSRNLKFCEGFAFESVT